jgi:hypothetical protein
MEICYGCGAKAEQHPILGVMNKADVKRGATIIPNPAEASPFVGVPVCKLCHEDPEHRTVHALKCHFFSRGGKREVMGLVMAGSADIGG